MALTPTRRGFITGLICLVAAPAIVRAGSLMPVKEMLLALDDMPDPIVFRTGGVEILRITSNGDVLMPFEIGPDAKGVSYAHTTMDDALKLIYGDNKRPLFT